MKSKIVSIALAALMVTGFAQAGLNMIPNPSFEVGSGDMPDCWQVLQSEDKIEWVTDTNTGSKSMKLSYNNPEAIIASIDLIPVTAGTEYRFNAWIKSIDGAIADGTNLRLSWKDAAGNSVGGAWNGMSWYGVEVDGNWSEYNAVTMEAPEGAVAVEHAWLYTWKAGAKTGVYIGDVSMTAVPEPMTLCLLGLGGLMLRRKKA